MNQPATPAGWVHRCAGRMRELWPDMDVTDDMLIDRAKDMLEEPQFKHLGPEDAAEYQRREER